MPDPRCMVSHVPRSSTERGNQSQAELRGPRSGPRNAVECTGTALSVMLHQGVDGPVGGHGVRLCAVAVPSGVLYGVRPAQVDGPVFVWSRDLLDPASPAVIISSELGAYV